MAKVLVIDDGPDLRSFLRKLLEEEGHEVSEAPDGGLAQRGRSDIPLTLWSDSPDPRIPADDISARPYGGDAITQPVRRLAQRS